MSRSFRRLRPVFVLLAFATIFAAADIQIPPTPSQWVTDTAGFLSPQTADSLNAELRGIDERTGHQVLIYIGKTTAGVPVEDYATKAFEAWKPGRKGLDDGLILFIFAEDRKIKIEVGYGLEDKVPDAIAGRIINEILVPRIQAGDHDGAVLSAVRLIEQAIGAETPSGEGGPSKGTHRLNSVETIAIIIGAVIFLIIFITHPSFALWLLFSILSGGRGGGGGFGGGGGGFSGGGGRSGGGGASGGW